MKIWICYFSFIVNTSLNQQNTSESPWFATWFSQSLWPCWDPWCWGAGEVPDRSLTWWSKEERVWEEDYEFRLGPSCLREEIRDLRMFSWGIHQYLEGKMRRKRRDWALTTQEVGGKPGRENHKHQERKGSEGSQEAKSFTWCLSQFGIL